MRLLHITPYYEDAWAYGGIPRVVSALAKGLVGRGHEVTVCTTDACDRTSRLAAPTGAGRGPWPPFTTPAGVKVWVFPNFSNKLAYDLQFFVPTGLGEFLRRHAGSFDVAHLHACHNLPVSIGARHLQRAAVPYLLSPHGTAPLIERRRIAKRIFDLTLGRGLIEGAARALAVSEAERRRAERIPDKRNPFDIRVLRDHIAKHVVQIVTMDASWVVHAWNFRMIFVSFLEPASENRSQNCPQRLTLGGLFDGSRLRLLANVSTFQLARSCRSVWSGP